MSFVKNPSRLLVKIAKNLFSDLAEQEAFIAALTEPNPPPPHIVWLKPKPNRLPWSTKPFGILPAGFLDVAVLPPDAEPGKEKLHEEGFYYCMDPSSIACLSVVRNLSTPLNIFVDLCSAPGGKGILSWHCFRPEIAVFNEVIHKRISSLIYNLKRCGVSKGVVTQMDPQKISEKIPGSASLVLVDAPCSGQSLLARGASAPGCFHPVSIKRCAGRQRRILVCAGRLAAPGGYLAYTTCTFSRQENEEIVEWFLKKNAAFSAVPVPSLSSFQSHLSEIPCYRFWPHRGSGSGSFAALLKNRREGNPEQLDLDNLRTVWRSGSNHRENL